jgi:putative membrane protein
MTESSQLNDPIVENPEFQPTPHEHKGTFTDHLANERTFLAWIRTSLGIFAFGCAISRFGGTDQNQGIVNGSAQDIKPLVSGLVLVACGVITMLYSIYRYYRINRQILQRNLTEVSQIREPIIATFVLLLSMIVILVAYIIL